MHIDVDPNTGERTIKLKMAEHAKLKAALGIMREFKRAADDIDQEQAEAAISFVRGLVESHAPQKQGGSA